MAHRLDHGKASPEGYRAMLALETHCRNTVDPALLHLVKLRASQINGCAYCIDMHWRDARTAGIPENCLYGLEAWRECPWYTDRERAALGWTEAVTLVASSRVPDDDYEAMRAHFDDKSVVDITWAVIAINAWNRLSIAFRSEPPTRAPR
ncbi:MAG: carboxymuconolactone decarboxylase family protein [Phycisphaeraceae bacterium]|nr:carboxymuconolactone decarboxylase family protein [Phycisphaeraceae bacterium]